MREKNGFDKGFDQPEIVSQYAFGVRPDRIGEIVILMERDRIEQYKGAFDRVLYELRGGVYHGITGFIEDKEVSAIFSKGPCDIGDCVSFLAMSRTKCQTIFSTGSIGGLGRNVEVGDLIIARDAIGNDGYSLFHARQCGRQIRGYFDNIVYPNGEIINSISNPVKEAALDYNVNYHLGRLFTIPGVSLENDDFLREIINNGCIAIDMETAPFYAACQIHGFNSAAIHWVTDLPLTRNFFYRFHNSRKAQEDWDKKSPIWLNMANIITDILRGYINNKETAIHEKAKR
jgi:purine-nucleoside phosphorylase